MKKYFIYFSYVVFLGLAVFSFAEEIKQPRLTLSMVMKNEGDRYLRRMLESVREYITDAVIIDDASTDNSVQICEEVLQGIPLVLIKNSTSKFSHEVDLRRQQWEETIKTKPEWILFLDADEIFEPKIKDQIREMLLAKDVDVYAFRLYDLWDENHYRNDQYWGAHHYYIPFIVRYNPSIIYSWKETSQHCGRFPQNIWTFSRRNSDIRLKHYGWALEKDRKFKAQRYKELDPDARYGWKEQYDSILDPNPVLVKWED